MTTARAEDYDSKRRAAAAPGGIRLGRCPANWAGVSGDCVLREFAGGHFGIYLRTRAAVLGSRRRIGFGSQNWVRFAELGSVRGIGFGSQSWVRFAELGSVRGIGFGSRNWVRFAELGSVRGIAFDSAAS
jgi:hypothetical protein